MIIMKLKELEEKAKEQIEREEELKIMKLKNNVNLQKIKKQWIITILL